MFGMMAIVTGRGKAPLAGGGSSLYTWYPSLDKNTIPFHAAAGNWGAQSQIQEASGPTITSTANASTGAELATACYTPGTRVTLTADIDGAVLNGGTIQDVEVVIPTGRKLLRTAFGNAGGTRQITRLRLRGDTLGAFGGGQVHEVDFYGPIDDLIVEGVNMSGPGGNNGAISVQKNAGGPCRRMAIHNVRANCGGYFLLANIDDVVIAGCSLLTAQDTVSPVEAWGNRWSRDTLGNVIEYANDIRASTARGGGANNTYHRSRRHPNPGALYHWCTNNTFIDRVQSRIFLIDAAFGSGTGTLNGAWFDSNLVIATYASGANGRECHIKDATYGRITNNTFQSDQFTSTTQLTLGTPVTDGDKTTGNVFQSLPGSDPAWGAAGDPSAIDWTV